MSENRIILISVILGVLLGSYGAFGAFNCFSSETKTLEIGIPIQNEIENNWRKINYLKEKIGAIERENESLLISVLKENNIVLETGQSCSLNKDWTLTFYKEGL